MVQRKLIVVFMFFALVVCPAISNAAIITYSGQDNGVSIGGPYTNSAAAQSSFVTAAALLGTLNTITFENQTVGFVENTSFTVASGVSVSLITGGLNFGNGDSGISDISFGNQYGFNTTLNGSKWLGFPGYPEGKATFSFATPTNSFGMYLTGLQNGFNSTLTISFDDGSSQTLDLLPVTTEGGAEYFGFTDANAFSSITITNVGIVNSDGSPSIDLWGIDDITYNGPSTSAPEPATMLLLGFGLMGLAGVRRKFKK